MNIKTVVAVLCSDLHLCHTAPSCREEEPDWYAVQKRVLDEVIDAANKYHCPLIIAGDIFDKWSVPPELINFAIDALRRVKTIVYAVPGQHDLPNHDYTQIHRSAYGSLIRAGVLHNLSPDEPTTYHRPDFGTVSLYAFPWGYDIKPVEQDHTLRLAVIHKYIWRKGSSYPGAAEEANYRHLSKELEGYHAAIFGDNHKGFLARIPRDKADTYVLNNGAMMRRKTDEVSYQPQYGLFYNNGTIDSVLFSTKDDILIVPEKDSSIEVDAEKFHEYLQGLRGLEAGSIDYREQVMMVLDKKDVRKEVREYVLEAMGQN